MKAEIQLQKKAFHKAMRKGVPVPAKAVTYKHEKLGEMTSALHFTKSVKVLPPLQ